MSTKVHVSGTSPAAAKLREYLTSLDYMLAESGALYTLRIDSVANGASIEIEGIRSSLAEETQHAIADLSGASIVWRTSAVASETSLRIIADPSHEDAVARGALRAILKLTRHGESRNWLEILMGRKTKS